MRVEEVATELDVSVSYAYKIIKQLNNELKAKGFVTISGRVNRQYFMVGKGSVTHNNRSFTAENVDSERTHLNIDYCNEPIKKVYHELFDEALKQYNDKQKRKDRKIPDYYKHIESGKQEKPLIQRLKNLVRTVLARSYQGWENYHRINNLNGRLYSENKSLKHENSRLRELNNQLRDQNKAYRLLEKVFGKRKLNEIIEQARGFKKSKQRDAR